MKGKSVILIRATECQPEVEEKFNTWYNQVHIPMLFKFEGMREVIRCKLMSETKEHPKYLAIYKFESKKAYKAYEDSPELAVALEDARETWKDGGSETKWRVQYEVIKTWTK